MMAIAVLGLILLALWAPTASALEIQKENPRGQIATVTDANVSGERVGLMLAIERGVDRAPHSELWIVPDEDPANWSKIELPKGPGAMATGDVTGNGHDEIAITHNLEGSACPYPGGQMPCGVVRVYDGRALVDGELEAIAEVKISPDESECPPTNYPPAAVAMEDVTGDGLAELAIGQLGMMPGSCGVVHAFDGRSLEDTVAMEEACARMRGPRTAQDETADHYGSGLSLVPSGNGEQGFLAVGAPRTNANGMTAPGRLLVYDVTESCSGSPAGAAASSIGTPRTVLDVVGSQEKQILGSTLVHEAGRLWAGGHGPLNAYEPPDFEQSASHDHPGPFPLSSAGDVNGDGVPELIAGPTVVTTEAEPVLVLTSIGQQTFRGTMLSEDHLLASDDFGMRLWSFTDLRTPFVKLDTDRGHTRVGERVNVSVSAIISLVPESSNLTWSISGGEVVEQTMGWIHVRADSPGHIVAQVAYGNGSDIVRVPVLGSEEVEVVGPSDVHVDDLLHLDVQAPDGAEVRWQAPEGEPLNGSGDVETRYTSEGRYTVSVDVRLPDGNETTVEHDVRVLRERLTIVAPERVDQGQVLRVEVEDPDPDLTYVWRFLGERVPSMNASGRVVELPVPFSGVLAANVVAETSDGTAVGVGQTRVEIVNQPPEVRAFDARTGPSVRGFEAMVQVQDPGGDDFDVRWLVDGEQVGTGEEIAVPDAEEGRVNLTVVVTDEFGERTRLLRPVYVQGGWEEVVEEQDNGSLGENSAREDQANPDDEGLSRPTPWPGTILLAVLASAALLRRRDQGGGGFGGTGGWVAGLLAATIVVGSLAPAVSASHLQARTLDDRLGELRERTERAEATYGDREEFDASHAQLNRTAAALLSNATVTASFEVSRANAALETGKARAIAEGQSDSREAIREHADRLAHQARQKLEDLRGVLENATEEGFGPKELDDALLVGHAALSSQDRLRVYARARTAWSASDGGDRAERSLVGGAAGALTWARVAEDLWANRTQTENATATLDRAALNELAHERDQFVEERAGNVNQGSAERVSQLVDSGRPLLALVAFNVWAQDTTFKEQRIQAQRGNGTDAFLEQHGPTVRAWIEELEVEGDFPLGALDSARFTAEAATEAGARALSASYVILAMEHTAILIDGFHDVDRQLSEPLPEVPEDAGLEGWTVAAVLAAGLLLAVGGVWMKNRHGHEG